MKDGRNYIQIHRFRDRVATYVRGAKGQTAYLSPAAAHNLGMALIAASKECGECSFVDSKVGTFNFEESEND